MLEEVVWGEGHSVLQSTGIEAGGLGAGCKIVKVVLMPLIQDALTLFETTV